MTRCIRCHRPLSKPTETGMGAVCAKASKAQPVPAHERDLFGFDIDLAIRAALYRLRVQIELAATDAVFAIRGDFRAARQRLGLWK